MVRIYILIVSLIDFKFCQTKTNIDTLFILSIETFWYLVDYFKDKTK